MHRFVQPVSNDQERFLRRILIWCAVGFAIFVAMLPVLSADLQQQYLAHLSHSAKDQFGQGGITALGAAGLNALGWVLLLCSNVLIITASWFMIETTLCGLPRRIRWVGFVVLIEAGMVVVYFFTNPYIQTVLPVGLFDPLLQLRSDPALGQFRYFADLVLASLAILVRGFFGYWVHRILHAVPWLWHFHAVHHSIEDIDAVTDLVHPIDGLVGRVATIVMAALLGFEYETFAIFVALYTVFGQMHHTRAPISLGPLGKVLVDRNFHLTHHSLDPKYFDRNFSATLVVYDKWFGTYVEPDGAPVRTGLPGRRSPKDVAEFVTARLRPNDDCSAQDRAI